MLERKARQVRPTILSVLLGVIEILPIRFIVRSK